MTFTLCCQQNQPRFSRDAIAEFELTTNRFDATKGRTAGMMVNAITKSGTNTPSGTFSGYFRDDGSTPRTSSRDRRIPYSKQAISGPRRPDPPGSESSFREHGYATEPSPPPPRALSDFKIDMTGTAPIKAGHKVDGRSRPDAAEHALHRTGEDSDLPRRGEPERDRETRERIANSLRGFTGSQIEELNAVKVGTSP